MFRRLLIAAAMSTASLVCFAPAASAQTYGGVTLSFGSGGYGQGYGYGYPAYRSYYQPRYRRYYYDRDSAWIGRQRYEQHERWEQQRARQEYWRREERARRDYWRHEHAEHRGWHDDDDN